MQTDRIMKPPPSSLLPPPPLKKVIDDPITYREGLIAGELARHCEQLQESPQVVGAGQRHPR